jgi:hypothetical protein
MRENWFCLDCASLASLDKHGRCAKCTSDAVVSAYAHKPQEWPVTQYSQIQELERIAQLL